MKRRHLVAVLLIVLLLGTSLYTALGESLPWRKTMEPEPIACKHLDQGLYPPLDPEADTWFEQAKALAEPKGQPIDFKEVADLYRRAAEKGHYKAMNNLAILHLGGYGVERSEAEAVKLYERMLSLGIPEGYMEVGLAVDEGLAGLKGGREKALEFYRKAARMGHPKAQTVVAVQMLRKSARYHDPDAIRLLECAVEQDYAEAAYQLAVYYKYDDNSKAVYYYRRGTQLGHAYCLDQLKRAYRYGALGLNKDLKRAQCLLGLKKELRKDPTLTFPDLDQRCPGTVKQPY